MKRVLICILLVGCQQKASIEKIDGCEYITIISDGKITAITHKGNCSNPIHTYEDPEDSSIFHYSNKLNKNVR